MFQNMPNRLYQLCIRMLLNFIQCFRSNLEIATRTDANTNLCYRTVRRSVEITPFYTPPPKIDDRPITRSYNRKDLLFEKFMMDEFSDL